MEFIVFLCIAIALTGLVVLSGSTRTRRTPEKPQSHVASSPDLPRKPTLS